MPTTLSRFSTGTRRDFFDSSYVVSLPASRFLDLDLGRYSTNQQSVDITRTTLQFKMASPLLATMPSVCPSYQYGWGHSTPKPARSDLFQGVSSSIPFTIPGLGHYQNNRHHLCSNLVSANSSLHKILPVQEDLGGVHMTNFAFDKVIPTVIKRLMAAKMVETLTMSEEKSCALLEEAMQAPVIDCGFQETAPHCPQSFTKTQSVDEKVLVHGSTCNVECNMVGSQVAEGCGCEGSSWRSSTECLKVCKCKKSKESGPRTVGKLHVNKKTLASNAENVEASEGSVHEPNMNALSAGPDKQIDCNTETNSAEVEQNIFPETGVNIKMDPENENQGNSASGCPLKLLRDLTSVLFDRKKCTKKGRPSSKKQKKRRREKKRQSDRKVQNGFASSSKSTTNGKSATVQFHDSAVMVFRSPCGRLVCEESDISQSADNHSDPSKKHVSSPVNPKPELQFGSFAAQFFFSGSEDDSNTSSDFGDDSSFSDDDFDLSDGQDTGCVSPQINILLGMPEQGCISPEIQHIPCRSNGCLIQVGTTSADVDGHDSAEFFGSPTSWSEEEIKLFSPLLNNDFIDLEADDIECSLDTGYDCDLQEVNAKWNSYYSSSDTDVRSAQDSVHPVCSSSAKVHFAADPVVTIHLVGTEDRRGEWMAYAVDRERFGRFIQQCSDIISPILSEDHRAKMYKRNNQLEKMQNGG